MTGLGGHRRRPHSPQVAEPPRPVRAGPAAGRAGPAAEVKLAGVRAQACVGDDTAVSMAEIALIALFFFFLLPSLSVSLSHTFKPILANLAGGPGRPVSRHKLLTPCRPVVAAGPQFQRFLLVVIKTLSLAFEDLDNPTLAFTILPLSPSLSLLFSILPSLPLPSCCPGAVTVTVTGKGKLDM